MKNAIRLFYYCLLLLLLPMVACSGTQSPAMLGTDGNQYTLTDYVGRGKWVVVNVWATRCPYCRHELFDLGNFHERHYLSKNGKQDAMILGLTIKLPDFDMPDRDYVAQFKEDYLIDYPLLLVDQQIAQAVIGKPVNMVPLSFFYNPKGQLVYQIKGMVTKDMLEQVIQRKSSEYKEVWAKEMPPEYSPKK